MSDVARVQPGQADKPSAPPIEQESLFLRIAEVVICALEIGSFSAAVGVPLKIVAALSGAGLLVAIIVIAGASNSM